MGNSGTSPEPATDCRFVADEDTGLDVPYLISPSDNVVIVFPGTRPAPR